MPIKENFPFENIKFSLSKKKKFFLTGRDLIILNGKKNTITEIRKNKMSQGCVFPAHGSTLCIVCVLPATRAVTLSQITTFTALRLYAPILAPFSVLKGVVVNVT